MKRRLASAAALAFFLSAAGPAALAAEVVLKDGSTVPVSKPYVVKGTMAILTRADGSLVSLPLSSIDVEKTAKAMAAPAPAPTPAPTPVVPPKPLTPAEAAKMKGARRATVVLTDSDVALGAPPTAGAATAEKGEGEVSIGGVQAVRTKTGYSFSGTVVNSGGNPVEGVSVSIELVGEEGKTITTGFGRVAKPTLAPGESAAFEAEIASAVEAKSFRYVPRWQVRISVKAGKPSPGGGDGDGQRQNQPQAAAGEGGAAEPPPASKPEPPKEQPTPPPLPPGYAAPQASGKVEGAAGVAPEGLFVPRPSDNQAKPPQ